MDPRLAPEVPQILRALNSWWEPGRPLRPAPPPYRRRRVDQLVQALRGRRALIQVLRGPRQVGKTTALHQLVQSLLAARVAATQIFLIRFDLQPLQEAGLLPLLRWYETEVLQRGLGDSPAPVLLLDEVHKLERWADQVKHVYDTYHVRMVLTGSSSVLVARGQRESLAGRALTVDFPPFLFREVLECWKPALARPLGAPCVLPDLIAAPDEARRAFAGVHRHPPQRKHSWRRLLERYYNRGGYPRLHAEEEGSLEDRWADYLVETVFDRVLGVDIPDLFPVEQPQLLRHIYLELARRTGTEVSQGALTQDCNAAGFRTAQPVVGRYVHYLADAMLIREFRRHPLARSRTARVPVKVTLTDLGVRNAIFRGAPSLWESAPEVVGPLVETLVQSVLRGVGLQVHFYRDYETPGNRRSPSEEVDFVPELLDGTVIPVEVKFRRQIRESDVAAVRRFVTRFRSPFGIVVTRDFFRVERDDPLLCVPLVEFLLAF
jgi:hypothetical protein